MAGVSPTVRRRRLGLILRGLREKARLTGEEVGAAIERSGSWVSRVETGRVGLRGRDLNDLLELYHVDDRALSDELLSLAREGKQRGWWSKYADTLFGPYATYIGFESEAAELLVYETLIVHGLLQTEEYARALFSATIPRTRPRRSNARCGSGWSVRQLLTRPNPLRLWAIFDESVLQRRIGGPTVLRSQMKHLLRDEPTAQRDRADRAVRHRRPPRHDRLFYDRHDFPRKRTPTSFTSRRRPGIFLLKQRTFDGPTTSSII